MKVEVAYALPDKQSIIALDVQNDCLVIDAIKQSKIIAQYPEIKLTENKVGIFGKLATLETKLSANDRVEIYRPLIADAKEIRRQKAKAGQIMRNQTKTKS